MAILKITFMIAITMAVTLTLTLKTLGTYENESLSTEFPTQRYSKVVKFPKRVSRFLVEQPRNARAADHCHKDNEICHILEGKNSTCCNNKCMDLSNDKNNCGACKNKCKKYTDSCCGGKCVDLAYDKGNCGECAKNVRMASSAFMEPAITPKHSQIYGYQKTIRCYKSCHLFVYME